MEVSSGSLTLQSISPLLTEDILHRAVVVNFKSKHGDRALVPPLLGFRITCASDSGDGYMGVVYRIHVTLEGGVELSLIGKAMPANVTRRKTFKCDQFFAKEILFFNRVLPAFLDFEKKQRGVGQWTSLLDFPECYFAVSDGSNDFLLMEDLNETGYRSLDRSQPVSLDHTKELFRMIARFHAFSLAMKAVQPETFRDISQNIYEPLFVRENGMWTDRYIYGLSQIFIEAAQEKLPAEYLATFKRFVDTPNFFNIMNSVVEQKENAVFNHGDAWVTNFMFRGSHVKAIDLQLLRLNSPAFDLSMLLCACTTAATREQLGGLSGILSLYQGEMSGTMALLGAPPKAAMTEQQLQEDLRKYGVHGFGFAIELVQLSLVESEDVANLDRFEGNEAVTLADITPFVNIKSAEGRQRVQDLIRFAVDEKFI